ncbi:MAG: hypothetical protein IT165_32420 [Bryobacterales bacterium]|nr:hypothetical protein [Bryobacterales bacterium]
MFFKGSRYQGMETYTITAADGRMIPVVKLPLPRTGGVIGYHARKEGQRLDHLAALYLKDATAFWKLCDANDAMVPDALAVQDLIGIPAKD